MFHWLAFTQEQLKLVLFWKYQSNTLGQSQTSSRLQGSMKGMHVTDGSGSELLLSVSLGSASPLTLPSSACSALLLASASQINYSIHHPACRALPQRWWPSRKLSITKTVLGRPWSTRDIVMLYWIKCAKGNTASETVEDYILITSHQPPRRKPADNCSRWFSWLLFCCFLPSFFSFFLFFFKFFT